MHSAVERVGLLRFEAPIRALASSVAAVDLRSFEAASGVAWQELHPITTRLVDEASSLVAEIVAACSVLRPTDASVALDDPFLSFEKAMDAAVASGASSAAAVEDVAFLVRLELRQRRERLSRIGPSAGALAVIGECDSALRRIRKGLGAIDIAIARAESIPAGLDFSSELQTSLLVRRAYGKLRARLLNGEALDDGEMLYRQMRAAGTQIAILVGWDAYPLLRVRDRLQLRELQSRILEWLHPDRRGDRLAGLRLRQDVVGFVEMLSLVNRRQELLEHDGPVITEACSSLADPSVSTADVVVRLRPLDGLDDELDQLIVAPSPDRDVLRAVLARLASRSPGFADRGGFQ